LEGYSCVEKAFDEMNHIDSMKKRDQPSDNESLLLIDQLTKERDEARSSAAEYREQLDALIQAIELVSKLAAMDSNTYSTSQIGFGDDIIKDNKKQENPNHYHDYSTSVHSTAVHPPKFDASQTIKKIGDVKKAYNRLPPTGKCLEKGQKRTNHHLEDCNHHNLQQERIEIKSDSECNMVKLTIQSELDSVLKHWKLEETPLMKVMSSIHRLQSHLLHVQSEADTLMPQVHSHQHDIIKYKARNKKLENAVKKLYKNNLKLVSYLKDREREHKSFVKTMKDYVKSKKTLDRDLDKEELDLTNQLLIHEKILQMGCVNETHENETNDNDRNKKNIDEHNYDLNKDLSFASSDFAKEIDTDSSHRSANNRSSKKSYDSMSYEENRSCISSISSCSTLLPSATISTIKNNDFLGSEGNRPRISSTSSCSTMQSSATTCLSPVIPQEKETLKLDTEHMDTETSLSMPSPSMKNRNGKSFMDVCRFMSQKSRKKKLQNNMEKKKPPLLII